MTPLIAASYPHYLECLGTLAGMPSVFTRPQSVRRLLEHVRDGMVANLTGYRVGFDSAGNLIACPDRIDPAGPVVYLSAHADTVDADPAEWTPPFHPFHLWENDREMVARGVSDCKAGIAYQLLLSHLAGRGDLRLNNVVFTVTLKEEGAGPKTATAIGEAIGRSLPVGERGTFLLVLENTVRLRPEPTLSIYTKERGNFVIEVEGTLDRLRAILTGLSCWNPVVIRPAADCEPSDMETFRQPGGHVCSVGRHENLLTRILLEAEPFQVLTAGSPDSYSVVPPVITIGRSRRPRRHILVLSNRTFDDRETVRAQLAGIPFRPLKDFAISTGFDISERFCRMPEAAFFDRLKPPGLAVERAANTGCSDGSIIFNTLSPSLRQAVHPIVCGPGTRSQRDIDPPRLTHGRNETFDKAAGRSVVLLISRFLEAIGSIAVLGQRSR